MKIKPEDYNKLSEMVNTVIKTSPDIRNAYIRAGFSEMRYRWDLYHSGVNREFQIKLYEYLNDDNIDSALKKITNTK